MGKMDLQIQYMMSEDYWEFNNNIVRVKCQDDSIYL